MILLKTKCQQKPFMQETIDNIRDIQEELF